MVRIDGLGAMISLVLFIGLLWAAYRYGKYGKVL